MADRLATSMLGEKASWFGDRVDATHRELLIYLAWIAGAMWQLGYYDGWGRCFE